MLSAILARPGCYDAEEFERAFTAADFDRCRELVDGQHEFEAVLASARVAIRERRYMDVINALAELPRASTEARNARDVMLGLALGLTRDYSGGRRLIARALKEMSRADEWYYEAVHYNGLIAWMTQQHAEAQAAATEELESLNPNVRARARILLSWVALRRGEILRQVDELQKALDELDATDAPDQYVRANALVTLALLCFELPLHEVNDRARSIFEEMRWTSALQLERFHVTRSIAGINELEGNELAAFSGFKKASKLAPSDQWSILCYLDRAQLARSTGERIFAREQLQEAHEIAQRISWNEATGEERAALLVLAELFADDEPAIAEQYLVRYRTISSAVIPILSYGTDPRVKGFEAYSQGVAWLRLGDVSEAKQVLSESWAIFEQFNYDWRAALCALALHDVTSDRRWLSRAARKIQPWPHSWIARRINEASNASVLRLDRIPPAKRQVLELVRAGKRNSEIAGLLGRSPNTVRNQLSELFTSFGVKSRAELVAALSRPITALSVLQHHRRSDRRTF
jgi:DNA-binding CsgD family transcriptional regulator